MMDRYVIVSAHHCAPGMGSEHAVGWNLVSQLARKHRILLITQDNEFRVDIENAIADLRSQGCVIEAFYVRHGARIDGRQNNLRLFYYLSYEVYQRRVLALAKELITRYPVAAVHHLTIVGFREPGYLWRLGLPFIWGPVGGLVYTPASLLGELSPKMQAFQLLRNAITWLQFHLSPRVRQAYLAAQKPGGAFIAATPDIGVRFQRRFGGSYQWIPETGAHAAEPAPAQAPPALPGRLRLLWVGALVDIKPMGILLDAIHRIPDSAQRISLRVIGDGGSRKRYEEMAARYGIAASFEGWKPHELTKRSFNNADLFVLLSMKDLTTNVVFEALNAGLPVLCLNHHGYADIVDDSCGFRVPLGDAQSIRTAITARLEALLVELTSLQALQQGALDRAAHFSWTQNAQRISALFDAAYAISPHANPSNQQP